MSAALGLCALLAVDPGGEVVELVPTHFRVRDPNRDLMLGIAPTLGDKLFAMGSPNPAIWAPELGVRFVFGSWRYGLIARAAVAPLVPLPQSIADRQSGAMLEAAIGARLMPLQHRVVRAGFWLGLTFDEIRASVTLAEEDGGGAGRKRVGHVGPTIAPELAFPLVFPRANHPWSMDIFVVGELRLELATRSTLWLDDGDGETRLDHRAAELPVIGPFSGAIGTVRIGVEFRYDLVTAGRAQSRADQ